MQNVIIDQPYDFVPPVYGDFWPWLMHQYLKRYLRKAFGVYSVECRDAFHLQESIDAGNGIIVAPNHCRMSDPLTLGYLSRIIKRDMHAMASWHLFKQDRLQRFVMRRMGAFSVYREGIDRKAIDTAVNILVAAKRPLVIFGEGAISRHNDVLMPMMDGISFIARTAAKRREKLAAHDPSVKGGVVVHPVAIRYFFKGDVAKTVEPVLEEIESHFSWFPQQDRSLTRRLQQIGQALLSLKEIEYFGAARTGDFYQRVDTLIEDVLNKLEAEWQIKEKEEGVVARVKAIRSAVLPGIINKTVSAEERQRRWKQLAACYYVQQMSHYPRNYVRNSERNIPEHILETVERFEEDFTDRVRVHGPLHAIVQVGKAIPVSSHRDRSAEGDPIMNGIRTQLTDMLTKLSEESPKV
jgi:1-acyl-sn-glycerol-3-phosphate acyltransferase